MDLYIAYWKRGWWAWLMMFLANLSLVFVFVPLAFALASKPTAYWIGACVAWLAIYAPLWGWLFEKFAAGSQRIATSNTGTESA
jgi:hypothetical protein